MSIAVLVLACCTLIGAALTWSLARIFRSNPTVNYAGVTAWGGLTFMLALVTVVLAIVNLTT